MSLKTYHKKRDFSKTAEPKGKVSNSKKNLFIIQKHAASHLHYDFRLELNGVLLSWAVPKGPCLDPSVKRLAMHVEDHPVEYGSFEGIIPKGEYGGGTVMLWDKGKWHAEDADVESAYKKGHLRFTLKAKKLNGRWNLIKFKKDDDKSWFLIKSDDEYARSLDEYDITLAEPNSVLTNESLEEITADYKKVWTRSGATKAKRKTAAPKKKLHPIIKLALPKSKLPIQISPQLATLVDSPPAGEQWMHEIKLDGYRILTFKDAKKIRLMSRNNKEWTAYFENIVRELKKISATNIIFDGEVVLLDEQQHSSFQLLQNAIKSASQQAFIYYIFDLLFYNNHNLMTLPLIKRKTILKQILDMEENSILRYSDHILGSGEEILSKACELGLEGIVSKKVDSLYEEKRSKTWLKVKCTKRQEFVIGGFTKPQGSRSYFGSLFLGVYNKNKELVFCGNVGTGFNAASLKSTYKLLQQHQTSKNPFTTRPPGVTSALWVEPKLVAEVEFSEWTKEGILRHPSFQGLRIDKEASKIIREEAMPVKKVVAKTKAIPAKKSLTANSYRLTHPEKVLYPEGNITKLDLYNYYDEIADWILPYIAKRPLTLVRCPDNYKECFYQKHINNTTPDALYGISIKEKDNTNDCIYIKDKKGLMALVQMGALEVHPWGSTVSKVEYPDVITFDLDPAPDITWEKVTSTAQRIRQELAKYKLKCFVKTTGGKGMHIVVPILPEYKWDHVKNFTHVFVDYLVMKYPNEYVGEMSKAKRKGKIFIDYLRNQRGATAVGAYSTRAREGAPVSTPLDWNELSTKFSDNFFTIATLPARLKKLKKDPWKDFFVVKQSLNLDKL